MQDIFEGIEMKRMKGFLAGLLTVLALVAMLVVWIALPWFAVLGIAVAIALWLWMARADRPSAMQMTRS